MVPCKRVEYVKKLVCSNICPYPCKRDLSVGEMGWGMKARSDTDDSVSCTVHLILLGRRGFTKADPTLVSFFFVFNQGV